MSVRTVCPDLVSEGTTFLYRAVVKDETGAVVPGSDLLTLTLTIHLDDQSLSPEIVNGVYQTNILNTGRGTVDASGNLSLLLVPADNQVVHPSALDESRIEIHILSLEWTYLTSGGLGRGRHEIELRIRNMFVVS
jgi:hypothetical protein